MKTMVALALLFTCLSVCSASLQGRKIRIGNYFVFAPNGVAFIYNDIAAFVIDPGGEYFAGEAAPDDSYHSSTFEVSGATVKFEWGRSGDRIVGRFTASRDVVIPLRLLQPWPGWTSSFSSRNGIWMGLAESAPVPNWTIHGSPAIEGNSPEKLVLPITSGSQTRIVAGFGELPRFELVDRILDQARSRYLATVPSATGDWGDFLGAICRNLGNSRIYSNDDHRVAISVSRRWADGPNNEPYFCWDSFFNGALASLNDRQAARETVRAILSWQTPEGLVPNFGHWNFNSGRASNDRSQPPVGALCVWKMNQRWPSRRFLEELYPKLLRWHRWWPTARDGLHDGLLEWGSSTAGKQGALWETGWDDTVEYEGAEMQGATLNAYAVDLNSLWAMDAEYLSLIARYLGKLKDAETLDAERNKTIGLINEKLWNPEIGAYCSRLWDGRYLTRMTPMNFYPLIAGVPDRTRAQTVLKHLKDPNKFWGRWILPTVGYDDPAWHQQDYWKGKVWAPVNFLVSQGLLRYGDEETIRTLAAKSVELFMTNWTAKGVCGENYLSSTGEQSSDPHYTWGSLLCLLGLESVCQIRNDDSVVLDGGTKLNLQLNNVPIAGNLYQIRCSPGSTKLFKGDKLVAEASGSRLTVKLPTK